MCCDLPLFYLCLYSACTWIASKLEDRDPPQVADLVYISDRSFTADKLRTLEKRIINRLHFGTHRVTPMHFVNQFLRASHACTSTTCTYDDPILRQLTMYLLEVSRISFDLSYRPPSLVAAAAVYLARATLGTHSQNELSSSPWTKTLEYTTGCSVDDLKATVLLLHKYHSSAGTATSTNASFLKYSKRTKYLAVALKPALRIDEFTDFDLDVPHEELDFGTAEPSQAV